MTSAGPPRSEDVVVVNTAHTLEFGRLYPLLRRKLLIYFRYRGWPDPWNLADETVARVVGAMRRTEIKDINRFALSVAHNVHVDEVERVRREAAIALPEPVPPAAPDPEAHCLEQCLRRLSSEQRELIEAFFLDRRRKELAGVLGLSANALRLRVFKLKRTLRACKGQCLEQMHHQGNDPV